MTFTDSLAALLDPRPEMLDLPLPAVAWVSRRYSPRYPLPPVATVVEHARIDRTVGDQLVPALLWDADKALAPGLLVM